MNRTKSLRSPLGLPDEPGHRVFPEHSRVATRDVIHVDDGRDLPKGTLGVVVGIWANGKAYEIETFEPFHTVLTVRAEQLTASPL